MASSKLAPLMSFGAPQWFWGWLLLPVPILLFVRGERRAALRLHEFVSPRLFSQLAGTVNRFARILKFALQLAALAFALAALAEPRWGYSYEERKRQGLDLIFAIDTSRSMLSNDVQPNRLARVKLAAQDLVNDLQGDRVGVIAFAGRAFLQAPLTIDYNAAVETITDLDTKTIPEGGTNISEAIELAVRTFGKSAVGNRALVVFADGEELSGDAVKAAKAAAEADIRIFTIGVGTPEGSLIPVGGEEGETAFVKDGKGQVVKSKLDEKRLREIAETTGGIYLQLENGPRTMQQLLAQGLAKMKVAEIDARLARRPIERYEWPLGAALLALTASLLINERKRRRVSFSVTAVSDRRRILSTQVDDGHRPPLQTAARTAGRGLMIYFVSIGTGFATAPGLDLYQQQKFGEAYAEFQKALQEHPQTRAADKIQFDSGAAAYKMKDYKKALESFSQALLSRDPGLQSSSHYNLGNTLYQRGEAEKTDDKKLTDWTNALQHYEQTLKVQPQNKEAKDNYEFVRKKIEELKKKREQPPTPTPTPSPSPPPGKNQQQQNSQDQQQDQKQQQQQPSSQDQDEKDQQQQQQQQQQRQQQQQNDQGQSSEQNKNEGSGSERQQEPKSGASPSPGQSPSPAPGASPAPGESPSPAPSQSPQSSPSPNESGNGEQSPSPTPGEGGDNAEQGPTPSTTPANSPPKKFAGDVKGASGDQDKNNAPAMAEAEPVKEGEMSPEQAERLLQSMKDEEERVQLDERRASRHVYNDW